jgi:hypothetical protein
MIVVRTRAKTKHRLDELDQELEDSMKRRKQIFHFDDINRCHEAMGFSTLSLLSELALMMAARASGHKYHYKSGGYG